MQNHSTMEHVEKKQSGIARWGGLALVLFGSAFFVSAVFGFRLENWWALFILMPALVMFGGGWALPRQDNGRFSLGSRFFFASGLVVSVVAGMFLLNMDWSVWWPLMIAAPGFSLLVAVGRNNGNPAANAWRGFFRWLSAAMIGLGGVFLAYTFGLTDLDGFGRLQWWGVFIALPAMGALLNAVRLAPHVGIVNGNVIALFAIALTTGTTAIFELFDLSYTYHITGTAVILIGSGLVLLVNGLRSTNE